MSSTFGQPQAADAPSVEEQAGQVGGVNGASAIPGADQLQEVIDPNDPMLTSEALDANVDADAYAFPPPPPDGKYRAKLKLVPNEQTDAHGTKTAMNYVPARWGKKNPQLVLVANVEASIIDPSGKYDNVHVYDRTLSTFLRGNDKASKMVTLVSMLKRPDGTKWVEGKQPPKVWADALVKALAGEPEIGIETTWEWSCQACGEAAKKKGEAYPRSIEGMQKFPQDAQKSKPGAPVYQSEMRCQVNAAHGFSRAQVRIARFLALSDLK